MAEEKYISKVRISGENFVIRDKAALAAAEAAQRTADNISVPVTGVTDDITFKDANGKMFKLKLEDKNVKLVAVTYNAPTASIMSATWNGVSVMPNSGNATISRYVDEDGTNSVVGNITGSIITANASKPTVSGVTGPSVGHSASPWSMDGYVEVKNNASVTIEYTAQGSIMNPSTNVYDKKTCTFTISRTATIESGWAVNAAAVQPGSNTTGGFKFNINSTEVIPATESFGNNATVTLTPSTAGYIYIFTDSAKSFVMSTDKATVDSAKLGGGIVDLGTVGTYTINKSYYVYRSLRPCTANTKVYVKAIV